MLKEQKGITLVALIITIIVMLILAGVSISLVVGDDGVLSQAQDVEPAQIKGALKEAVALANADMIAAYYANSADGSYETNLNPTKEADIENFIGNNFSYDSKYNATLSGTTLTAANSKDADGNPISITITVDTSKPYIQISVD